MLGNRDNIAKHNLLYIPNNNKIHISDQATRIKRTYENLGNKSSHVHGPTEYTTRTTTPGKKKHTYIPPSPKHEPTHSTCALTMHLYFKWYKE
jgi:hypothetical protein